MKKMVSIQKEGLCTHKIPPFFFIISLLFWSPHEDLQFLAIFGSQMYLAFINKEYTWTQLMSEFIT